MYSPVSAIPLNSIIVPVLMLPLHRCPHLFLEFITDHVLSFLYRAFPACTYVSKSLDIGLVD